MQKHHEQISWTTKSTRCYMYVEIESVSCLGLQIGVCSLTFCGGEDLSGKTESAHEGGTL